MKIALVSLKKRVQLNLKAVTIYKEFMYCSWLLLSTKQLNTFRTICLLHHYYDFLHVYHSLSNLPISTLLIENDRSPKHYAVVQQINKQNKKSIKYDNWLIDPIHHNDIYCQYYYYPSTYHYNIHHIQANDSVTFLKGGFLYWDRLNTYQSNSQQKELHILYFTQFGIPYTTHLQYVNDIKETLQKQRHPFKITLKSHPKEDIDYASLLDKSITVISDNIDIYQLISTATYCFSIFSTVSLEAKHIINNSVFINYDSAQQSIIDYDSLGLDVITSKNALDKLFKNTLHLIPMDEFIQDNNINFPNSCQLLYKQACR